LYDALSAGVPSENVFEFLRTASKAAVAGATTTAQSVDFLTTAINAFRIPASDAEKVADVLFNTVEYGKTTVEELAASFATVGPIAAASGVQFEQVMAAVGTLAKQGTPTSQAMTQIRAAIVGMNKVLGDGWSKTMTLQEGMQAVRDMAGGSLVQLQDLIGRMEGVNGILGNTSENAEMAAQGLRQIANGAGSMNAAFEIASKAAPLDRLKASIGNVITVLGDRAIELFGPAIERGARAIADFAERINDWAANDRLREVRETIEGIIAAIAAGGETRREVFEALADLVKASFAVAAERAGRILEEWAPRIGKIIGQVAAEGVASTLQPVLDPVIGLFGKSVKEANEELAEANARLERQKELLRARGIFERESVQFAEQKTAKEKELEGVLARLVGISERQRDVVRETADETGRAADETNRMANATVRAVQTVATAGGGAVRQATEQIVSSQNQAKQAIESTASTAKTANESAAQTTRQAWQNQTQEFENNEQRKASAAEQSASRIATSSISAATQTAAAWSAASRSMDDPVYGPRANNPFWGGGSFVSSRRLSTPSSAVDRTQSLAISNLSGQMSTVASRVSNVVSELQRVNTTLQSIKQNEENLLRLA
jgi:TP901 family phage tail tape measure protein